MELTLVLALVVVAAIAVARTMPRARVAAIAALLMTTAASAAALRPSAGPAPLPPARPKTTEGSTYVSSNACRGCHPSEHASFSRTFHRTMTQDANAQTILAPPESFAGKRVVLTTGSHREQAYWVAGGRPGELVLLPFVWMIREKKMLPRAEAFLTPPDVPLGDTHWSGNCIACHAVAGEPRRADDGGSFATRAAELGIACEACHGPGAAHVEKHRDPIERYLARGKDDATIVNPKKLTPERASAVCGQCHAYAYPRDEAEWWKHGYARTFRAGDALEPSRTVLSPANAGRHLDAAIDSLFWKDGTIRVGGREYNGMTASKCVSGGLTCISCHAMHRGDPAGQIAPDRVGDRACTSTCHAKTAAGHSHHQDVACVDCHMPKTSYALLSAVRSHRIDSPRIDGDKPNTCNLCHLDRSRAWSADALANWYGRPRVAMNEDRALPEGMRLALAGDAAMRVLVADALASPGAIAASGRAWQAPLLAELRRDPYAAVRFVADRSARNVDASAPALDQVLVERLLAARDLRAISIAE